MSSISRPNHFMRFGAAAMASAIAVIFVLVFRHPILPLSPFLVLYAAVAFSSWYGGTGPGLVTVAAGVSGMGFLLLEPVHGVRLSRLQGAMQLVLFLLIGALIACLNGALRHANQRCAMEAELARKSEAMANQLAAEMMMVEERERRRIASVLHDAVVQMLALSKIKVDRIRRDCAGNGAQHELNEVYELIDQSISHARTLTADLSPPVLYELGLPAAIQWLGDRLQRDHGIRFEFEDDQQPKPLNNETRLVLFHAARELILNIVKHANASRCQISLRRVGCGLVLSVSDNGSGFIQQPLTDYSRGGVGLFNIHQRLSHLHGRFEMNSQPGAGSRALLYAPLFLEERIKV